MKLTTRGRYAVTAMMDLVMHGDGGPVSLADIADRQGVSRAYLEQLFSRLRRARLVTSTRGPGGGYCLARESAGISVAEVFSAVEDSWDATQCAGAMNCQSGEVCLTHDLWAELGRVTQRFLAECNLAQLARQPAARLAARRQANELTE